MTHADIILACNKLGMTNWHKIVEYFSEPSNKFQNYEYKRGQEEPFELKMHCMYR